MSAAAPSQLALFPLTVADPATRPALPLSRKRRAILDYLAQNSTITLAQATALVGRDVYANQAKHTGALLAAMVKARLIVRHARGVFALPGFVRMFKLRFALLVEAGTKRQTVRPVPKRMPRPGDRLSLRAWSGAPYRSPQRILREAIVASVRPVGISADGVELDGVRLAPDAAAEFARADGFADVAELVAWFAAEHALPFDGIVIAWGDA